MILPFENWVNRNSSLSEDSRTLFTESIVCYKSAAYRAALLLSYLGFMTCLKERVLNATIPTPFPAGEWDSLMQKLRNEDLWENCTFDLTQRKEALNDDKSIKKVPVFNISESQREEIKYWKNKRNECAHNKRSIIIPGHVEIFWTFLKSNLSKITVEGGMESLIQKISKHYDVNFTPSGKDVSPLILEIETAVTKEQLHGFW